MNERRAEVQRNMARMQLDEVEAIITALRDSREVAYRCGSKIAVVSTVTASRAERQLWDLKRRFLTGLAEG